MKLTGSKALNIGVLIVVIISLAGLVQSATKISKIKAENLRLTEQVSQLTQAIEERDNKIASDRELYTNLAGRLHKEMKKVEELEDELKKGRRR